MKDMEKVDVLVSDLVCMLGHGGQKNINANTNARLCSSNGFREYDAAHTIVITVLNKTVNMIMRMVKKHGGNHARRAGMHRVRPGRRLLGRVPRSQAGLQERRIEKERESQGMTWLNRQAEADVDTHRYDAAGIRDIPEPERTPRHLPYPGQRNIVSKKGNRP